MSMKGWTVDDVINAQKKQDRAKRPKKESKYGNQEIEIDGFKFDSKGEGYRYLELKTMMRAGAISNLRLQVPFELAPAAIVDGKKKPALIYIADFVYRKDNRWVVEDFKGVRTDVYKIKRHLMKTVHRIDIFETERKRSNY